MRLRLRIHSLQHDSKRAGEKRRFSRSVRPMSSFEVEQERQVDRSTFSLNDLFDVFDVLG
jgi:hypothetical protein